MNSIRYTVRSTNDLVELLDYIAGQDGRVAQSCAEAIKSAVEYLALNPARGLPLEGTMARRYTVKKYKVTVYFRHRPRKRELEILRIIRGSRIKNLGTMPR
jgi:plasmid stabilization system protein ParE